ncbi:VOC family protein [Methylobacterium gnaphalii]|uniref:Glyoxalase n=1 Tax=Methylobacterium gnaphalii TaxID=1010610 RepID=A0A512JJ53_9HYPH|nr:VOC family protein [Methylobacterium gnaphalii]GEP09981.1 glyoxalase [Methylobacterium gnaphalii]GJD68975.1 Putative glyoxylase CFP32 [Methylobacterium gnaphalii]GLS48252.1 glyoxalase [Methylobacterium gnaphalii]
MGTAEGCFVWYELMTSDPKAAEAFYRRVLGWTLSDSGHPSMRYTLASVGDRRVAGIMEIPAEVRARGGQPGWIGYVAVADIHAKVEQLLRLNGILHRPVDDIPGIGRFAVVADPQGATFVLFCGTGAPPPQLAPGTPGDIGWHELYAHDWASAFDFYEALFGWKRGDAVDIGAMGTYQLFRTEGRPGTMASGGMMSLPGPPAPSWLYYVNVEEIDAATERLRQAGGAIINGPMQVPGGMWVVQASDPQGAQFAIMGRRDGT